MPYSAFFVIFGTYNAIRPSGLAIFREHMTPVGEGAEQWTTLTIIFQNEER